MATHNIEISEWENVKDKVNDGDTLYIKSLVDFNNWKSLIDFVIEIDKRNINLEVGEETWLTQEVIKGFSTLSKDFFSYKVSRGMKNTKNRIGRKDKDEAIQKAIDMFLTGEYTGQQIAEECGIARQTLYRNLKKQGIEV